MAPSFRCKLRLGEKLMLLEGLMNFGAKIGAPAGKKNSMTRADRPGAARVLEGRRRSSKG